MVSALWQLYRLAQETSQPVWGFAVQVGTFWATVAFCTAIACLSLGAYLGAAYSNWTRSRQLANALPTKPYLARRLRGD